MPPRTIEQRVRRKQTENATNVANPIKHTLDSVEKEILSQASEIRKDRKTKQLESHKKEKSRIEKIPLPKDRYQTIVIDPPWPIQKILRDDRPNQVIFDYPIMSIEEKNSPALRLYGTLSNGVMGMLKWMTCYE